MRTLFLIVSTFCDLVCKDCFYTIGHEKRTKDRIRPEQAGLFAERIVENGFTSVILTGGDPLSSRFKHETYLLIEELKRRGIRVLVNTSATRLNQEDIRLLNSLRVNRIDISINSYRKEIHDAERGLFDDTVWAIKELLKSGYQKVSTTTVITEYNAAYVADTLRWLIALGVDDVRYQPVFLIDSMQDYAKIEKAMEECTKVRSRGHTARYLEACRVAYLEGHQVEGSICQMGKTCFVCDSCGNILPCFHREDVFFGNIITDSPQLIDANIRSSCFFNCAQQSCFGRHCVSLFDNSTFWR